jgi:hypothetical protein
MSSADEEKNRCFHIKIFVYSLEEKEEKQVADFWVEKTEKLYVFEGVHMANEFR